MVVRAKYVFNSQLVWLALPRIFFRSNEIVHKMGSYASYEIAPTYRQGCHWATEEPRDCSQENYDLDFGAGRERVSTWIDPTLDNRAVLCTTWGNVPPFHSSSGEFHGDMTCT